MTQEIGNERFVAMDSQHGGIRHGGSNVPPEKYYTADTDDSLPSFGVTYEGEGQYREHLPQALVGKVHQREIDDTLHGFESNNRSAAVEHPFSNKGGSSPVRQAYEEDGERGFRGRVILFSAPNGGIGLSTLLAMVAWYLTRHGSECAIVDGDLRAGGIDVLLGLEHDEGLRMSDIEAPFGRLNSEALQRDLVQWEGIGVLPCNPWKGKRTEWWELKAAVRALQEHNDIVLVDCGLGNEELVQAHLGAELHIVAAELSVLGLARAQAYCDGAGPALGVGTEDAVDIPMSVIGMMPRGAPHTVGSVSAEEAEAYLRLPVLGVIDHDRKLCADIRSGLGVRRIARSNRSSIEAIAEAIEHPQEAVRQSSGEERKRKGRGRHVKNR